MKTVWEYKTQYHDHEGTIVDALDKLGLEGWELVSCIWSGSDFTVLFILKREKRL